ncbi:MAG TPA: hypothetical protein VLT15_06905 [Acidimicrobiia bacterium]|nr:hypothetical protein [Acidimicrobiia bacterium]
MWSLRSAATYRRSIAALAVLLVASACTSVEAGVSTTSATDAAQPVTTTTTAAAAAPDPTTTTVTLPRDCSIDPEPGEPVFETIEETDLAAAALFLSRNHFRCSDLVVIAPADDLAVIVVAAQLAAAGRGSLLLFSEAASTQLNDELARLAPTRTVLMEVAPEWLSVPSGEVEVLSGSLTELADLALRAGGAVARVGREGTGPSTIAEALLSISTGRTITAPTRAAAECDPGSPEAAAAIARAADERAAGGETWLIDVCSPGLALLAGAALGGEGTALLVDGRDLRGHRSVVSAMHAGPEEITRIHIAGEMSGDADWHLGTLLAGTELPGGGLLLFPGRRLVALYGNPATPYLGVLGEQGVEEAIERARRVAEPYGADGVEVLPAFEIIASVASVSAGSDGDYSSEMSVEVLLPWVEAAGREGLYVVLDLQPGRSDFLDQARLYEELLLLPHVGLALDPEWRLKPNQVHLTQIGSVDAAEVNRVAEWLAHLVRANRLPQKLLIVHQFNLSMITNRGSIERPPELAVMIHADGQGPIGTKYTTYSTLTGRPDADQWWWGWKNFYDEDSPTPTPEQVLDLDPLPSYVSYQ